MKIDDDTGRTRKRIRSSFDVTDEFSGAGGGGKRRSGDEAGCVFFDLEAVVDGHEEEEVDEEGQDCDFIVHEEEVELGHEDEFYDRKQMHHHRSALLPREEDDLDVDALKRSIRARYAQSSCSEYYYKDEGEEEWTEVHQQALLPSVTDSKLWLVKCSVGRAREVAICLMQKYIEKGGELKIRSAIALDHLKDYVYIEADKEAHVREACKGLSGVFGMKILLVPIKEMTDVLSVESKSMGLSRDTWVSIKTGKYKGDPAQVIHVDNVRKRVMVKLKPRVYLQAIANKSEGKKVVKNKTFVPPPRFVNAEEARKFNIRVGHRRDPMTGDCFEYIDGMMFKDGFLYKTVSMKSICSGNIVPAFASRRKGHFVKGDAVIVTKGDLKNLTGWVERVDEKVYIRTKTKGLKDAIAVDESELCKNFELGNHVKVVSGLHEGKSGMVVQVEQPILVILSDITNEHIRVLADDVEDFDLAFGRMTKIGHYELHDLVVLNDKDFGVIIRVESDVFQVLKGVPGRPEVITVGLRDIKSKINEKFCVQDRFKNRIAVKDVVRIVEGPYRGEHGSVEHIYQGVVFIYDHRRLENAGIICAKSVSCIVLGGSRENSGDRHDG